MKQSLHALIAEDVEQDARLVAAELELGGFDVTFERVDTEPAMRAALQRSQWDIVLCDFSMPQFDGLRALSVLKELSPETPLIYVSGRMGEETAVKAMKSGAQDYVMKTNLARLTPAIERELAEARIRREARLAEKAMRESEHKYHRLFEALCDAVFVVSEETGCIVETNKVAEELLGRTRAELVGSDLERLWSAGCAECATGWVRAQAQGRQTGCDLEILRKDGTAVHVLVSASHLTLFDGPLLLVMVRDITERKAAEKSLGLFRALLDQANDMIEVVDPNTGRFLDVNKTGCAYHGYSREELLSLRVADLDPDVDPARFAARIEQLRQRGSMIQESVHRRKDGTTFPVEVSMKLIHLEHDYMLASVRDITDRKQVEQSLRESEEEFRLATTTARDAIIMLDNDGKVTFWNDAAETMLGYSRAEALGRELHDWLAPERYQAASREGFRHFRATGEGTMIGKTLELSAISKSGVEIPVELSVSPLKLKGLWHAMGIMRDLSARKKADAALMQQVQDSLGRAAALIELTREETAQRGEVSASLRRITQKAAETLKVARVSIWSFTAQHDRMQCEDLFERASGQHSSGSSLTPADYPAYFQAILSSELIDAADALADARTREFSASYLRPLGISSMLDAPVYDQGKIWGVVCHEHTGPVRQWTHEEKSFAVAVANLASQALENRDRNTIERRLLLQSSALNAAANAIVITNREGAIEWINDAFVELTGYVASEVIGQNPRILKSGQQDPSFYQGLWTTISAGKVWRGTLVNKRKDGALYNEEMTITPVRAEAGEITHFIAVKGDITERLKAEKVMLRSQRMDCLGALAGGIAHDLNNALAPIMMSIQLLKEQYPNESKILDTVSASTQRGADMVRQLLTFAKGAEGSRIRLQPLHLLKEMQNLARSTFPKNIVVTLRAEPKLPLVAGDATQLHQVLLNLCVNARDAMPHGGQLKLQAETREVDQAYAASLRDARPGRYVVVRVQDTGVGIPPEVQDRLFEPFFTTKDRTRGTGLGLATVLGIVKSHGGFVQVDSEVGKGSMFAVYLPVAGENGGAEFQEKPAEEFRGQGETILLVDDEIPLLDVGRLVLQRLNFKALTARDGAEGFAVAMEHKDGIRAILFDLHMPYMDGVAFARALRWMLPEVPMAVVSGRVDEFARTELQALGVTIHLPKPFTEHQLAEVLRQLFAPK